MFFLGVSLASVVKIEANEVNKVPYYNLTWGNGGVIKYRTSDKYPATRFFNPPQTLTLATPLRAPPNKKTG